MADLRSAKNCIGSEDFYFGVFACQQAVEKALKSFYLLKFRELPRGHSILYLSQKLRVPNKLMSGVRDLNPEYLITRYPDMVDGIPADMYDLKIASRHLKTAEEILRWVKKQLKK